MVEAKENGCICDECAEQGIECTNVAESNEDQCSMCAIGIHGKKNKELTDLANDEERKKALVDASLKRLREIQKNR